MQKQDIKITTLQQATVLINSTIGISVLSLPRLGAKEIGTGTMLLTLIVLIILFLFVILFAILGRRHANQTLIEYGNTLLGKPINFIFGILLVLQFLVLTALILREFAELMAVALLRETPLYVIMLIMLITVMLSIKKEFIVFGYTHMYYFPYILVPGILLIMLLFPKIHYYNLLPVLGNHFSITNMTDVGTNMLTLPFFQIGLFTILIVIPRMKKPKKALKSSILAWVTASFIIMSIIVITFGYLGSDIIKDEVWPVLTLSKSATIPLPPLQRLDVIFVVFWIITGYTTIFTGYFIANELCCMLVNIDEKKRHVAILFVPVVFTIALIPKNHLILYEWMFLIGKYSFIFTASYPILLLIISLFKYGWYARRHEQ
ncbi:spore germination protein YndE [Paraliobacillus ryukyuensis]|uniref:Spore germination protein n=1 Tax=Paraliobacillus ryukyuensis TaxID=200904 RepID=A0A366EBH2_9BACI|nr:endospore germination permease [Paraliobacillus ryukyuensis]RBO99733.1 spore germination protein [Paraliobacillus ryukyuensis]